MAEQQVPQSPSAQRVLAGRYAVLGELGRGGMGVVWLAEDRTIGRRVAIKELHLPDGVPDEERRVVEQRVLREARAAGRLNDPAVVTVHDVVQEAGATFIVMELVEAPTLSDVVRQQGPLTQDQVARLGEQLLSALETAHAIGVVHRDVKPSNIMLLPNGRVKLADFGIAQSLEDPRLTTSGMLVGSPSYMAPERIRGEEASAGSDLWSLGAVLFYAVEGHGAFERSTTVATMHAITSEVPFLSRCQGPLASVIMGLLNATPQARPTAAQVRGLLAQVTQGPVSGPQLTVPNGAVPQYQPTGVLPAPRRGGRRSRLVLVTVAVLVAGAFAGGLLTGRSLGAPDVPPNQDPAMTYGAGGDLPEFTWTDDSYEYDGVCLQGVLTRGRRFTETAQIDCAEPHDIEVFDARDVWAVPDPDSGDTYTDIAYPGRDRLVGYAEQLCTLMFNSKRVSWTDKDTELRYRAIVPSERAWSEWRHFNCVLYREDGRQLGESVVS